MTKFKGKFILDIALTFIILNVILIIGRVLFCFITKTECLFNNIVSLQTFRMDIACSAYLIFPLLIINTWVVHQKTRHFINLVYIIACINIILITDIINANLFNEWGELLDSKAFSYLFYSEGWKTLLNKISIEIILLFFGTFFFAYAFGAFFFNKINFLKEKLSVPAFMFGTILLVILARGGFQKIPINSGSVYINQPVEQNLVRVNKLYYLAQSLIKHQKINNIDTALKDSNYKKEEICSPGEIGNILRIEKPNIFLIILEGVSKDLLSPDNRPKYLDGLPFFERLKAGGIEFTNIYSSGFRTDQGLLSIYSGLPAMSELNVMKEVRHVDKMPSLFKTLNKSGYTNSFFYGGDLAFSEMSRYLTNQDIKYVFGRDDFTDFPEDDELEWGLKERYVLSKIDNHLDTISQPFFTSFLTSSTHPPFDIVEHPDTLSDEGKLYVESVRILDRTLEQFFNKIKDNAWYANTMFIIVSDHGSRYLKNRNFDDHLGWKVPLFCYGDVLRKEVRKQQVITYGNHYDLPQTIESILGLQNQDRYRFSRNLFCESPHDFGFWTSGQITGMVKKKGAYSYAIETLDDRSLQLDSDTLKKEVISLRKAISYEILKN